MAAILPGYEYDIFISYRQNDNKRDGWVSNFVARLQELGVDPIEYEEEHYTKLTSTLLEGY